MHDLLNLTPFQASLGVCQDRDGVEVAVAVVKATYRFDRLGALAPAAPVDQLPVFLADVHHGDPGTTSLRYASDLVPVRQGTDVAVNGHAYGRGRASVEAGFRVGALEKLLLVSGPRQAVSGGEAIAGPVGFQRVPLRYELAYGGRVEVEGQPPVSHPDNPVGLGLARPLPERAPLPQVEYPGSRFTGPRSRPRPAGLGFIPTGWGPRARFAGTFDAAWMKGRRPLLPLDLDERFYNAVPEDQVLRPRLAGGERLLLRHLHPEVEALALTLPSLAFRATFQVKDGEQRLDLVADSLLLEPDQGRLAIGYRASLPLGADLLRLHRVVVRPGRRPA